METPNNIPLAIESFSYSWLSNARARLSFDGGGPDGDHHHHDPLKSQNNFNFNFATLPHPSSSLVHADEIFSNGIIKPISTYNQSMAEPSSTRKPVSVPAMMFNPRSMIPVIRIHCQALGRWRKSTGQLLRNCFRYFGYSCYMSMRKSGCKRKGSRVNDVGEKRFQGLRSLNISPEASPPRVSNCQIDYWSDNDRSIYEAVLHCKRSIGTLK